VSEGGIFQAKLPSPGDIVGAKYVVEELIGQGGMGAVFRAKHMKLGNTVAIKVMLAQPGNPEASQRFLNEGRNVVNIQNDHVVRVFDVDEENGYAFMVLEFLQGEDLDQVLRREGRLRPDVAVGYVLQGLEGVAQAHAAGIVHRDLKPSNLYLAKRKDGTSIVKVLDFGISKIKQGSPLDESPKALTSTKAMLGSPLYMSPEQLTNPKGVDHRADIWAFGVIIYELITGQLPFMGETLGELFAAILETEPPPMQKHNPEVPPALDAVVRRCLQRRLDDRIGTVQELAAALKQSLVPGAVFSPFAKSTSSPPPPEQRRTPSGRPTGTMAMTPQSGPIPHVTPFGATTPQPHMSTSNTWQTSSSGVGQLPVPPKSNGPIIALVVAGGVILLGGVGFGISTVLTKSKPVVASSASVAPPVASTPPVPEASVSAAVESAAPSAIASASAAAPASAAPVVAATGVAVKVVAKPATPMLPVTAKTAATPSQPSAKPSPNGLQSDSRR